MYCKNIGKEAALERINRYNIQYFSSMYNKNKIIDTILGM